jgi:hypothetical protein
MRRLGRPAVVAACRMSRYGAGLISLLATGLLSGLITGLAVDVSRNNSRITEGATR